SAPTAASRWRRPDATGRRRGRRRGTRRGTSWGLSIGRQLRGLPDLLEDTVRPRRLLAIDPRDGEADVHQHVLADPGVRHVVEADVARDAREADAAHPEPVVVTDGDDLTRNPETHRAHSSRRATTRPRTRISGCTFSMSSRGGSRPKFRMSMTWWPSISTVRSSRDRRPTSPSTACVTPRKVRAPRT